MRDLLWESLVGVAGQLARLVPLSLRLATKPITSTVLPLDYPRHSILLHVDSWIEHRVRINSCRKEPDTVAWIEQWFKPDEVFYDIGANVGAYSFVAFFFLQRRAKVFAFEPGLMTFPQLSRNILLNKATEGIMPFQVALSNELGVLNFHYQNLLSGGALHALGAAIDSTGKTFAPVGSLPVLCFRLDDFREQFALPLPHHIKIDVDGTELEILQGALKILNTPQLRTILIEVDENHRAYAAILAVLRAAGFVEQSRRKENTLFIRVEN
jgi:FkbM family methyltransferase